MSSSSSGCSSSSMRGLNRGLCTSDFARDREEAALKVGYVTDVEGNWDFWNRYISMSAVLERDPSSDQLSLREGCQFVFGGDVCDRGAGDIRILGELLSLKERYFDRVHFILGNRDVNKMRLPTELHQCHLEHAAGVYWIPREDGLVPESAPARLKWALSKTLGSPLAFEYRRQELEVMGRASDDEAVFRSYLELLTPDGLLTKYIRYGKIAVIIGDTLFCHGALHPYNMCWLPPQSPMAMAAVASSSSSSPFAVVAEEAAAAASTGPLGGEVVEDFRSWVVRINDYVRAEADEFVANTSAYLSHIALQNPVPPHWAAVGGYDHAQPGSRLIQYGMGGMADKSVNPSVIYANYLADGQPIDLLPEMTSRLLSAGIKKVVVGHQPHGDAPVVIDQHGLQVFCCDTSYSATGTLWDQEGDGNWQKASKELVAAASENNYPPSLEPPSSENTRGVSVSEILFLLPHGHETTRTALHGYLSEGSQYFCEVPESGANKYIGKKSKHGWYVKAHGVSPVSGPLTGSLCYLLSQGQGYAFRNRFVSQEELEQEFDENP